MRHQLALVNLSIGRPVVHVDQYQLVDDFLGCPGTGDCFLEGVGGSVERVGKGGGAGGGGCSCRRRGGVWFFFARATMKSPGAGCNNDQEQYTTFVISST